MRDHLMGHAPAARADFCEEEWYACGALRWPLGYPVNRPGPTTFEDDPVPVKRVVRQCMTSSDVTGLYEKAADEREPQSPYSTNRSMTTAHEWWLRHQQGLK